MQWRELIENDGIFKVIQCALEPVSVNCWRTIPTGRIKKKLKNYCSWQFYVKQCKSIEQPYIIRIETIMQWRELIENGGIFKVIQCVALEPVSVNCWRTIPTGSIKKNQKITVLDNPPSISANRLNNHTSLESRLWCNKGNWLKTMEFQRLYNVL